MCLGIITPWITQQNTPPENRTTKLFSTDNDLLETQVKDVLKLINKRHFTRLTSLRISSHLDQVLTDRSRDNADSMITFSKLPPTGQRTSLYYYAPRIQNLQNKYIKLCDSIERHISALINRNFTPSPFPDSVKQFNRTGSEICPRSQTVANLAEELKNSVEQQRNNRLSFSLIDFHNDYTTYCVVMLGYASGYRAVRDPFYSTKEIDWETGFAVISDKDSDHHYNSRLVWLPPLCLEQIRAYDRHRKALRDKLVLLNPFLAEELTPNSNTIVWPRKNKSEENILPFFFFLQKKWEAEKVSPKTLARELEDKSTLPLNVNRHFLRTHLRESGVHGETVDAFMGHWERGQEPFGQYSTLTPVAFRNALAAPLTALLAECGWKVLGGIG